jgi:hypothetical protein
MPLLGHAGYLPFGLECAVIADIVRRTLRSAPHGWHRARNHNGLTKKKR